MSILFLQEIESLFEGRTYYFASCLNIILHPLLCLRVMHAASLLGIFWFGQLSLNEMQLLFMDDPFER